MLRHQRFYGFIALAVLTAACLVQAATPAAAQGTPSPSAPSQLSPRQMETWYVTHPAGWTSEAWSGDELPYLQLRRAIDVAALDPQKLTPLIARYKAQAEAEPGNSRAVFAWAYAVWSIKDPKADWNAIYAQLLPLRVPLATAPSPRTYDYVRLRFLIEAWIMPDSRLSGVGERLAERDPKDFSVTFHLVEVLQSRYTPQNQAEALALASNLVRWYPEKPNSHSALASVYLTAFNHDKKHGGAAADAAIAEYQQYLRLAPLDDTWRAQAQTLINSIHQLEAMVGTEGG